MATNKKVRATAVDIDELLGQSERRRRAYARREDVLEAAALIREMRKRANLSQKELADRIGTDQSHISELERGNGPQGPTFAMLKRIGRACDDPFVVVTEKDLRSLHRELEKAQKRRDELEREVFLLRAPAHYPITSGKVRRSVGGGIDRVRISNNAVVTRSPKGTDLIINYHLDPNHFSITDTKKAFIDIIKEEKSDNVRVTPSAAKKLFSVTKELLQTLESRIEEDKNLYRQEKASSRLPYDELAVRVTAVGLLASLLISKDEQR